MKTIIVTGPIGAGKSFVSGLLKEAGIPVYDCDSKTKALYANHGNLAAMATKDIFEHPDKLQELENLLFPLLMEDIKQWSEGQNKDFVAVESATILQKPYFKSLGDYVLLVNAPEPIRFSRVMGRGGISEESLRIRMALQQDQSLNPRVSFILENSGSTDTTRRQLDNFLKSINYGNTKN